MLKITGTLEVFQNNRGYVTGVFKAWNDEAKQVTGKAYMDVTLPKDVKIKEGQTLTLNVKTAYLNAVHVASHGTLDNEFTKLKINVVECEVTNVYPEEKKVKKSSKKVRE